MVQADLDRLILTSRQSGLCWVKSAPSGSTHRLNTLESRLCELGVGTNYRVARNPSGEAHIRELRTSLLLGRRRNLCRCDFVVEVVRIEAVDAAIIRFSLGIHQIRKLGIGLGA